MESERVIGRVLNIDSFKVTIELEKDTASLTKAHYTGIHPIARINSYVIIPVGFDKIVCHITKVQMSNESTDISNKAVITLPDVKRLLWATMIGRIRKNGDEEFYEQGIVEYPCLDNPVLFILRDELDCIFDKKSEFKKNDYLNETKKYYVPIGKSTAFPEYEVKIDPDTLFSKHLAVLGNTGSGKSCTIVSIIQTLLRKEYEGKKINNSHFIIFDTNGEYSNAFNLNDPAKRIGNSLIIDREGLKIPYWFMNFQDFINIFQPGEGVQLPVLSDSLLYARNKVDFDFSGEEEALKKLREAQKHYLNLRKSRPEQTENSAYDYIKTNHNINCENIVEKIIKNPSFEEKLSEFKYDVDTPTHFDRNKLVNDFIELAIKQSEKSNNKIRDYCSTMLMRMRKYFNDPRYDFLFHNFMNEIKYSLSTFLRLLSGRMEKMKYSDKDDISKNENFFLKKYFEQTNKLKENHQIIIIDFSLITSDILENVTALIARLILDFLEILGKDKNNRGKFPIVLVLEEAHNYIPEKKKGEYKESISKIIFERIAREGRKFGLSLVVSSQRPSELSKTVLSQCNSFIVHRIQNPEDQQYIKTIVPSINEDLLKQLPSLAQRTALIFGDCVRAPAQIYLNEANPMPDSHDPKFMEHWLKLDPDIKEEPDFEAICSEWEGNQDNKSE